MAGATGAFAQTSSTAPGPDAGLGIRLVEIPASRAEDPRAKSYIIDHLAPGTTIRRTIELSNGETRALPVELYSGGATLADGSFTFAERGGTNELSKWIAVDPQSLTIAPGARTRAEVTIAVPADARAGERYGVVWAETPGLPPTGGGVAVNSRVGIRVYLSVGTGAEPGTDFTLDTFQPVLSAEDQPSILIETCNKGGRAVDLTGEVTLAGGPGGTSAGPFATASPTSFAPGECGTVTVSMASGLPKGPWKATATLRSGEEERSSSATITFPDGPGKGYAVIAVRVLDSAGGRMVFLAAAVLLVLVLLAVAAVLLRSRRRSN